MSAVISKSFFGALFFSTAAIFAAAPAIGIVTASGPVTVERSRVWGNATLFDGATVETSSASSQLALRNGVRLQLAADSRARVWENRALLERGVGQFASGASPSFEIDAAGFKIRAADAGRVRVTAGDRIEVAALSGSARVLSSGGVLLASIATGKAMTFEQPPATVSHTGCLLYKDGHFILQDENTNEVSELNGKDLASNTGNRVTVTGTTMSTTPAVKIATSVLNVASVQTRTQGGCLTAAQTLSAQTDAPNGATTTTASTNSKVPTEAGTHAGMSTGAKIAIVAAIGGGGAGAAIALAGKKSSTSQ